MTPLNAVQPIGDLHGEGEQLHQPAPHVGEVLAMRLSPDDMMRIFRLSRTRFYALVKQGRFDRFEQRPTIGSRAWSGQLVTAYLNGEGHSSRFGVPAVRSRR